MAFVVYIRELLGLLIRRGGIYSLVNYTCSRHTVNILVYHDPSPAIFERHIDFLSQHCTFVSLDDVINAIDDKKGDSLPPHACVVTFDDGHAGNYHLLPLFKKYGIVPTIYLCSGIVGTNRRFWWKTGYGSTEPLKRLPYPEMLLRLEQQTGFTPRMEYAERQTLSAGELSAMAPYVRFGAHTRFHPILTRCDDAACREEIASSKMEIERLLGTPVRHFAYPNGDFSQREMILSKQAGYASARTIRNGAVSSSSNRFALPAIEVDDYATVNVLCAEIVGVNAALKNMIKKVWNYSTH